MVIVETLDKLTTQIEALYVKQKLVYPECKIGSDKSHRAIRKMISLCQDLYNQVELGLELLGAQVAWGEPTVDERLTDCKFFTKLISDLMGTYSGELICFEVEQIEYSSGDCEFEYKRAGRAKGGIRSVIQLLSEALGYTPLDLAFAELIASSYNSFQMTVGAIARLKSRLNWQVMYPDSLSKDSMHLRELMQKNGFDNVWSEFQAGLDNYRQDHLLDSTNRIANTTTLLLGAIAKMYKFKGGQLGAHTLFLEKLGFIHERVRDMISQFWGYLSKFRKGKEPSRNEAMLLLDLAFSIFGFLLPRIDEFKADDGMIHAARTVTNRIIKMRKEEARRTV